MVEVIRRLWSLGIDGTSPGLRRQVELCNQIALFGTAATIPYQLFYALYDFYYYQGVFFSNLLVIAVYLLVLRLNQQLRHLVARNLLLVNSAMQLWVVTYFISADAGVNLFYFTLASVVVFLVRSPRVWAAGSVITVFGVLYIASNFLFSPENARSPVPSPWVDFMYAGSVMGVLALSGSFLFLFRRNIEWAEAESLAQTHYLENLSNKDPLTGLDNRRVLDEGINREWARLSRQPGPLSVLMCDVDRFKSYNDYYGHDGGDECLKQIAAVLKKTVSRPQDLVARYGGEEFAVVLPGTDEVGARQLAERLRKGIEQLAIPNAGRGTNQYITISIGVSSVSEYFYDGSGQLLKRADEALYQAKNAGRNCVAYLPVQANASSGNGGS